MSLLSGQSVFTTGACSALDTSYLDRRATLRLILGNDVASLAILAIGILTAVLICLLAISRVLVAIALRLCSTTDDTPTKQQSGPVTHESPPAGAIPDRDAFDLLSRLF